MKMMLEGLTQLFLLSLRGLIAAYTTNLNSNQSFFISKIYKKELILSKNILNFDVFSGVKVVPFPEGINQLFVLYPVFL